MNKPLNIAHRGGANLWPENTLEAFSNAIDLGVDAIEFDIQATKDDRLIIHHDDRLKPDATRANGAWLTPPTPRLRHLTHTELKALDIGRLQPDSAYARIRVGQTPIDGAQIPDFAAMNQLVAARTGEDFRLYAELKTNLLDDTPDEAAHLAALFCTELQASPVLDRTHIISFNWVSIDTVRSKFPDLPYAYTTIPFDVSDPDHASAAQDPPDSLRARLRAASAAGAKWWAGHDWRNETGATHGEKMLAAIARAGIRHWFGFHKDITPETMRCAARLNLQVTAWTANTPDEIARLANLGVHGIVTDRPDLMQ